MRRLSALLCVFLLLSIATPIRAEPRTPGRFLYVASPGVRNLLEYGGHGVLVFDVDRDHKFVRRIPSKGVDQQGKPLNVKGICASAATGRLYVSTLRFLTCYDLLTDAVLWEREYDGGCDRMAISPDGRAIYLPSLEGPHWHVVDAMTGDVIRKVVPNSGAHNTVASLDGKHVYLAGLKSPNVSVLDAASNEVVRTVGPFSAPVRPFTVNGAGTLLFVNVNDRIGFEVGDARSGKVLAAIDVPGMKKGKPKRHGCPSHGIALTPDETELWVTDAVNCSLHVYDATVMPPTKKGESIVMRDEPGWVTFGLDGRFAYPSTGEVIDAKTRRTLTTLRDEAGRDVQSEKMLEIDFGGDGKVSAVGNQFGVGRKAP